MQIGTFVSVSSQTAFFLTSAVLGAAMGIVFDCFRVLRMAFPPAAKALPAAAEDILFWLIYGFSLFVWASAVCGTSIRFYMILGSLLGFVLYILTVGNFITGILRRFFSAVYRVLRKVYSLFFEPIVKFLEKLCQKSSAVFVGNHKNDVSKAKIRKNPLKKCMDLLYNEKDKLDSQRKSV